jgi:3D (Asp-Asp-Asp) domain-containing protein
MYMVRLMAVVGLLLTATDAISKEKRRTLRMSATAHSIEGESASGAETRVGTVAADPRVLPLGSRIRVRGARRYSGVYRVIDTGRAIKGNEIDIYMRSAAEAKKFGRQRVTVQVLEWGDNKRDER